MKFPTLPNSQAADIIKMKADETIQGVFRGDVFIFRQHWVNKQPSTCQGLGCAVCAQGEKPTFRFRINFVVKESGAYVAKIFEQGWTVFEALEELNKEYPLEKHVLKITRKGNGMSDTSYSILPVAGSLLNAAREAEIAKVKLHELDPAASAKPVAEPEVPHPMGFDEPEQELDQAEGF